MKEIYRNCGKVFPVSLTVSCLLDQIIKPVNLCLKPDSYLRVPNVHASELLVRSAVHVTNELDGGIYHQ